MSHKHTLIETQIAWELIASTMDRLELYVDVEDLDAALIATFATALELVSQRKLKPIYEIYADTKHV
jgi:predicted lipoprotein